MYFGILSIHPLPMSTAPRRAVDLIDADLGPSLISCFERGG